MYVYLWHLKEREMPLRREIQCQLHHMIKRCLLYMRNLFQEWNETMVLFQICDACVEQLIAGIVHPINTSEPLSLGFKKSFIGMIRNGMEHLREKVFCSFSCIRGDLKAYSQCTAVLPVFLLYLYAIGHSSFIA